MTVRNRRERFLLVFLCALCVLRGSSSAAQQQPPPKPSFQSSVEVTSLDVTVVDDGRGFDVAAVRNNGHGLGLVTMEERVNLVGGRMSIVSVPGRGTTVRVRGPVNPQPLR